MAMRGLSEIVGELYRLYPRHVAPRKAEKAISNAIKRLDLELKLAGRQQTDAIAWIYEAVECFSKSPAGRDNGLFPGYSPPYPATWFNQSRYLDDPEEWFKASDKYMRSEATVGAWRPQ